eukprot:CAMPEP_0171120030 /NCGR_PEP_ID=MMETSP0766_2-20121228/98652_1 /TAXON_ID=439317 /ORGANISM="Gambierdiscus australes, Strain CAWD 149" /LENGTH=77 /DNA_ID=CAMNT_0011582727 /DNA_START=1 /DNA_END=234 /DNA_ORIENTATION=+
MEKVMSIFLLLCGVLGCTLCCLIIAREGGRPRLKAILGAEADPQAVPPSTPSPQKEDSNLIGEAVKRIREQEAAAAQ